METSPSPLVIEPTPRNSELDEARKVHVMEFLSTCAGFDISNVQIVIQTPNYAGLNGVEAIEIDNNRLETLRNRGESFPGSTLDSSGFGQ